MGLELAQAKRSGTHRAIVALAIVSLGGLVLSAQVEPPMARYLLIEAVLSGLVCLALLAVELQPEKSTRAQAFAGPIAFFIRATAREKTIYALAAAFAVSMLLFFALARFSAAYAGLVLFLGALAGSIGGIIYLIDLFQKGKTKRA